MTSSFKALTDNTPPLLSGENIEVKAQPSEQSASSDNTPPSTPSMQVLSKPIKTAAPTGEQIRQHAEFAKVALRWLEKNGLLKRYKVLSKDRTTVKEIRLVLSPAIWKETLDLKLLSDGRTVAESIATTPTPPPAEKR